MKLSFNSKQHAYWLTPDGDGAKARRTKGVTTLAKIPDDQYAITQWLKRSVAAGMGLNPALVERAAAHHDDRDELDGIAEEALTAARAHEAAGRGTAAHRIAERIDLEQMVVDTPLARQVAAAWAKALDNAGLEVVPEYVERAVVFPDVPLCGTFDRIFRRKFDGQLVIGDIKTGARALQYPHAIAVQLAFYANAPLLAGKLNDRGVTESFTAMPPINKRRGYVIAMPNDETTVEVKTVDIEAGWDAAQKIVFPTLEWRARRDLVHDIETVTITPYADNIRARLGVLKLVDGGREYVAGHWPAGVPFKPPWDEVQGKSILTTIERAERDLAVSF